MGSGYRTTEIIAYGGESIFRIPLPAQTRAVKKASVWEISKIYGMPFFLEIGCSRRALVIWVATLQEGNQANFSTLNM